MILIRLVVAAASIVSTALSAIIANEVPNAASVQTLTFQGAITIVILLSCWAYDGALPVLKDYLEQHDE